jgi:pyridoxamine 5'-phosphate oxidase family protein
MSVFTTNEIEYLGSGLLGRLATVGQDGIPHIAPVGMISQPTSRHHGHPRARPDELQEVP